MDEIIYHNILHMQLRFCDADQFGHVNNSVYFQYYDTAKIHYMKTVCPQMDKKYAIVVVHIDADFLSQLHTDERVAVQTAVIHIGKKSFTLQQRLINLESKEVKCTVKTVMVAYDLELNKSVELLPGWVNAMCKYEGRDLRA